MAGLNHHFCGMLVPPITSSPSGHQSFPNVVGLVPVLIEDIKGVCDYLDWLCISWSLGLNSPRVTHATQSASCTFPGPFRICVGDHVGFESQLLKDYGDYTFLDLMNLSWDLFVDYVWFVWPGNMVAVDPGLNYILFIFMSFFEKKLYQCFCLYFFSWSWC